jgi:hypothetical protein
MISEATDHITSPPIDLAIDYHHALDNVNCLLQAIKNAVTTCVPLKTCTHHSTPWWCHNLTIMKRHATLATRQARLHNTNETRANAKQQRATFNKYVKEAKAKYWMRQFEKAYQGNIWKPSEIRSPTCVLFRKYWGKVPLRINVLYSESLSFQAHLHIQHYPLNLLLVLKT